MLIPYRTLSEGENEKASTEALLLAHSVNVKPYNGNITEHLHNIKIALCLKGRARMKSKQKPDAEAQIIIFIKNSCCELTLTL